MKSFWGWEVLYMALLEPPEIKTAIQQVCAIHPDLASSALFDMVLLSIQGSMNINKKTFFRRSRVLPLIRDSDLPTAILRTPLFQSLSILEPRTISEALNSIKRWVDAGCPGFSDLYHPNGWSFPNSNSLQLLAMCKPTLLDLQDVLVHLSTTPSNVLEEIILMVSTTSTLPDMSPASIIKAQLYERQSDDPLCSLLSFTMHINKPPNYSLAQMIWREMGSHMIAPSEAEALISYGWQLTAI